MLDNVFHVPTMFMNLISFLAFCVSNDVNKLLFLSLFSSVGLSNEGNYGHRQEHLWGLPLAEFFLPNQVNFYFSFFICLVVSFSFDMT